MPDDASRITGFIVHIRALGSESWEVGHNEAFAGWQPLDEVAGYIGETFWKVAQRLPVVLPF